jgi:hypothetical protein
MNKLCPKGTAGRCKEKTSDRSTAILSTGAP